MNKGTSLHEDEDKRRGGKVGKLTCQGTGTRWGHFALSHVPVGDTSLRLLCGGGARSSLEPL